jgi:predicted Zn-dependent peptidase
VDTANTVPSIVETLQVLEAIRDGITEEELNEARDYLVGVFPLRFETADAVAAALGSIVVQGLPDDEVARYRPGIEAVTLDDVATAARSRIHPEDFAIVLVGDADAFLPALEGAALGPITVERDPEPLPSETLDDIEPA